VRESTAGHQNRRLDCARLPRREVRMSEARGLHREMLPIAARQRQLETGSSSPRRSQRSPSMDAVRAGNSSGLALRLVPFARRSAAMSRPRLGVAAQQQALRISDVPLTAIKGNPSAVQTSQNGQ
jgi:hypothetical protein